MIFDSLYKTENKSLEIISSAFSNRESLVITYLNQHCFNIYNTNCEYRNLLDNNFKVFLDGIGIYSALNFLDYKDVQKFNATDLYTKIFQQFSLNQAKLFLIGSSFTAELVKQKAIEKNLEICGYMNGYFEDEEINSMIDSINRLSTDAIIVGMNVPKQEIVAARILEKIKNTPILCVGGFLEFYFGTKKRAPKIVRLMGLEWIHRLITEPSRLWKRYLIGIPAFIFQIIKLKFSVLINKD